MHMAECSGLQDGIGLYSQTEHHRRRLLMPVKVIPQGLMWTDLPSTILEKSSSPEAWVVRAGKVLECEL